MSRWAALVAVVVGAGLAFDALGLPSPVLFAGVVAGLAVSLSPLPPLALPGRMGRAGQAVVGASMGVLVDRSALAPLQDQWPTVAAVSVSTIVLSVAAGQLLRLHRGVTRETATFSSIAGGASGITAMAEDLGADDRVVTVVQYLRVLLVVVSLPAVVAIVFGGSDAPPLAGSTSRTAILWGAGAVLVCGLVGAWLGARVHLPSPALLGPLVLTAVVVSVSGQHAAVPWYLQAVGYAIVGAQVGLKFTLESLRAIGRMVPTALLVTIVIVGGCAGIGSVLARSDDVSGLDAYLATTPGGLYVVLGIASDTDSNITFVTSVQIVRLLAVLLLAPAIGAWLRSRRS